MLKLNEYAKVLQARGPGGRNRKLGSAALEPSALGTLRKVRNGTEAKRGALHI